MPDYGGDRAEVLVEDALGPWGFRVKWALARGDDGKAFRVGFWAYEVVARSEAGAEFTRAGAVDTMDTVAALDDAEVYVSGDVKWDECSSVTFQEDLHLCGGAAWEKHCALMKWLFLRAMALMGRDPESPWADPYVPPD